MTLEQAHAAFRATLEPFGIDVGPEVLDQWLDRQLHDEQPLPVEALRRVADLMTRLAKERE